MSIFFLLAASSMRSIALSGRNLSVMYLSDRMAAEDIASSVISTLWCCSYFSFSPCKISIVSDTVGCSTIMGWNLLSNAASFSKYFLYSSIVVAPMVCNSPRASMGLRTLATSSPPSPVDPVPSMV